MLETYTVIAYGMGKSFYPYIERLDIYTDILYFADSSNKYVGRRVYGDERICIDVNEIRKLQNPYVIITVDDEYAAASIGEKLKEWEVPFCHAKDILMQKEERDFKYFIQWPEKIHNHSIQRFIDINISGTTTCNFHCEYCYVWRKEEFKEGNLLSEEHSVKEIREGLSKERLGGICFINLCARGETLLAQNIVELIYALLDEGHYVSVVTNGTVTSKIKEILSLPDKLLGRMFFKISFHYIELKRLGVLERFWDNIDEISGSRCSYTLEITPGDGSVKYIDEMKDLALKKTNGALPHVSFTRDSNKAGFDLLSKYSIEDYRSIWGQFDSKMFDLKSKWYGKNMQQYQCYAGNWSYLIDLNSGNVRPCYHSEVIGNIFDREMKAFPVRPVDHNCKVSYCFNNHAFLAWGCVPDILCGSYLDMRNRTDKKGKAWLKPEMAEVMSQKLSDHNYRHLGKWDDYGKLYEKNRKPAVILFNSPDYPNLGDHAIALGERLFLSEYFPQYDIIEISCSEYMKENFRIKSAVKSDDIIAVTGGGNIGTLWLRMNDLFCHIASAFRGNVLVVFPQTLFYEDNYFGDKEKQRLRNILSAHKKLIFAVRDKESADRLDKISGDNINKILAPDMAFFLRHKYAQLNKERTPILLTCLRDDRERTAYMDLRPELIAEDLSLTSKAISTVIEGEVTMNNREKYLDKIMSEIASAKVVLTDRLHGMIFCALAKTPCVFLDNISGKCSGAKNWLKNNAYIEKCTEENVFECIERVTDQPDTALFEDFIAIEKGFERLADTIKKVGNIS